MGLKEVPLPLKTLLHVRAYLYPKGMSEDEDIIISCTVCGATADYDTPCPNGCDPLAHYLAEEIKSNMADTDFDVLTSISLKEAIELVSKWLEEANS
jgi:hypothetical protein